MAISSLDLDNSAELEAGNSSVLEYDVPVEPSPKQWAVDILSDLNDYLNGDTAYFQVGFVLSPLIHQEPNSADFHNRANRHFLEQLNFDPGLLLGDQATVTVARLDDVEVVGDIEWHEDGQPATVLYRAQPVGLGPELTLVDPA